MTQKTFDILAAIIFTIVAIVHLARLAQGTEILIDGDVAPMWISWVGLVVTAVLAAYGFRLASSR